MVDLSAIHSIFKMSPYASIILETDQPRYTIAEINDAFLKLTYSSRSASGKGFFDAYPRNVDDNGERTRKLIDAFENVILTKTSQKISDHRYDVASEELGTSVHYWTLDIFPMLDYQDKVRYIVMNVMDITEAKRSADLQQLEHDVLELNSKKNADIREVMTMYLQGIENILPNIQSSIMQVIHERLYSLVSPSLPKEYLEYIDGEKIGPSSGSCGTAAYTRQTVISADIQNDPLWESYKKIARKFDLSACGSHPIMNTEGAVVAVLAVYFNKCRRPSSVETKVIERVVSLLEVIMENRQYAESLKDATMLMVQGQELAQFGNWSWDIQSNTVQWSDTLYAIYGINQGDFPPTFEGYLNLLHPDDRNRVYELIKTVLERREDVEFEEKIVRPTGEIRHLKSWGKLKLNENGQPVKMIGACLDVTGSKKIENDLKESNELYAYVNKATNDAIYDWDIIENNIKWGDGFKRIFGIEGGDEGYTIEKWAAHVHPKDIDEVTNALKKALMAPDQQNWCAEYSFRKESGTYAVVEENGYIIRDASGKARRMIGVMRDITRLREIAWAQTHLVREPLTRIMSISKLLADQESEKNQDSQLLNYLDASADELDQVIRDIVSKSGERL